MYSSSRVVHELSSKQILSGATRVGTDTDVGESGVERDVSQYTLVRLELTPSYSKNRKMVMAEHESRLPRLVLVHAAHPAIARRPCSFL